PPEPSPPEPSLVNAVAPSPVVRAPPLPTAPSRVDPSSGRVLWKVSDVGGGITARGVERALSRVADKWTSCYQSALRMHGTSSAGAATLRLTCDDQGRVVDA